MLSLSAWMENGRKYHSLQLLLVAPIDLSLWLLPFHWSCYSGVTTEGGSNWKCKNAEIVLDQGVWAPNSLVGQIRINWIDTFCMELPTSSTQGVTTYKTKHNQQLVKERCLCQICNPGGLHQRRGNCYILADNHRRH